MSAAPQNGNIELLLLPRAELLLEGASGPRGIGPPTYGRPAALRLTPPDHLRRHIEGLQPQAEVRGDTEEGFADDNKCGNMEDGLRSQIMEFQPILKHEPSHKRIHREA